MEMTRELADELVALVQREYPGWDGFRHPEFVREEVEYKRRAVKLARELLAEEELRKRVEAGNGAEVVARLKKVAQASNLLYMGTPSSSDLAILHGDDPDEDALAAAVLDLLHGPGESPDRLDRFGRFTEERRLPHKWTFPTYFLFLVHPERDLFVKPSVTLWLLDKMGAKDRYHPRPDGKLYGDLLAAVDRLGELLEELGPRDRIDLQSFLWAARNGSRTMERFQPSAQKLKETEKLFDEFVHEYLDSDEGRRHAAGYEEGRRQARENYDRIREARDRGEDVTEGVLLGLLPHTDSAANREKGAWTCIAPAITGDLKGWFENVGWRQPDDWGQVAEAILGFVERCVERPEELPAACRDFSASPWSTGFQSGMLTPILNALDPDRFLMINNKSRALINYLGGSRFQADLTDYPEANRAGFALVDHLAEVLERASDFSQRPADALDAYAHWIRAVRKFPINEPKYWKIAPGEGARKWDGWRENHYIAIGWDELGDLSEVSWEEFERRRDGLTEETGLSASGMNQVWRFREIRQGDRVVANEGVSRVLGIGTVVGPYRFVEGDKEYPHRLPVEWDDLDERIVDQPGWRRTLIPLDADTFRAIDEAPRAEDVEAPARPPAPPVDGTERKPPVQPVLDLPEVANRLHLDLDRVTAWKGALERKKQAVFYGPPGTGKTFAAQQLARHLVGGTAGFHELVQLHPAYAYEDFVQGIRPRAREDGNLEYELVPGRFLDFCARAGKCEGPCVLILDELNRAELARVFGELMFLLEYRDREIPLAAGGRPFAIPDNVRILGTMNTADRSIALVDHALRRRFAFLRMEPDFDVLRSFHASREYDLEPLLKVLADLNQAIGDPDYALGVTFFLHDALDDQLQSIWMHEIEPYLEEYFLGQPETVERWRWQALAPRLQP